MDQRTIPPRDSQSKQPGLASRFLGIFFSPRATFEAVVLAPHWLSMLALIALIAAIFAGGFLSTEVGQRAWMEKTIETLGPEANEDQIEALKKIQPYVGYIAAGQSVVMAPLMCLAVSGLLYIVFSTAFGAAATFKQLYSVVVHSAAIGSLQQIFTWPLNYFRESMTSPTTLAVFLPMLDEGSFLFRFMDAVDLFLIWWIVVLSIGLSTLYQRKTGSITLAIFALYGIIALAVATFTGGS